MYEQNYFTSHQQQQQHHHQQTSQIGYNSINSSRIHRSVSNSNLNVIEQRQPQQQDIHVEYEVSMPVPIQIRHTPYHSLWNLHQWYECFINRFN